MFSRFLRPVWEGCRDRLSCSGSWYSTHWRCQTPKVEAKRVSGGMPSYFILLLSFGAGLRFPRGVLLYGPAGVGKSLLSRAVMEETGAHVIAVSATDLMLR